jgi:hypothetical protein
MAQEEEKGFWNSLVKQQEFWVVFGILIIGVCITAIVISYNHGERMIREKAMEQGYSQQSLPGQNSVYWVKDGKKLDENKVLEK